MLGFSDGCNYLCPIIEPLKIVTMFSQDEIQTIKLLLLYQKLNDKLREHELSCVTLSEAINMGLTHTSTHDDVLGIVDAQIRESERVEALMIAENCWI